MTKDTKGPRKGIRYANSEGIKTYAFTLPEWAIKRVDKERSNSSRGKWLLEILGWKKEA